jgi:hemoglobin-like flavoprotein
VNSDEEIEQISLSLALYAERIGDMVPFVYDRFFDLDKDAKALMACSDEHMRGRMFASVLELFMSDEHLDAGGYLDWELENHLRAYGATPAMYETFFKSVVTTLAEGLGDDWTENSRQAWRDRLARITEHVKVHESRLSNFKA